MMWGRQFICAAGAAVFASVTPAMAQSSDGSESAVAPTIEWHQRFTFRGSDSLRVTTWDNLDADWSRLDPGLLQFSSGERWDFTFGMDFSDSDVFNLDSVRAGATFNVSRRFSLGGELSFTSPEEDLIPGDLSDEAPEIRLESAFRF